MTLKGPEDEVHAEGAADAPALERLAPPEGSKLIAGGKADEEFPVPDMEEFEDDGGNAVEFIEAGDLERIAKALISKRPELKLLRDWTIAYRWKSAGGITGGKLTLGKCVKASGLVKHFGAVDWIVWLGADNVRDMRLTRWQVEALVYHELCHCEVVTNENGSTPKVRAHDFEGFRSEVEAYGLWQADLRLAAPAFQLHLFDDESDDDGGAAPRQKRKH